MKQNINEFKLNDNWNTMWSVIVYSIVSRNWSKQSAHGCLRPRVLGFGPLHLHCAILWHMTSEEGLGEMFEGDYAYMCTEIFPLKSIGWQVTQLVREPKMLSQNLKKIFNPITKNKPFRAFYHIYNFSPFLFIPPIPPPSPRVKSDGNLWFKIPRPYIEGLGLEYLNCLPFS